jgi:hypothetical protein
MAGVDDPGTTNSPDDLVRLIDHWMGRVRAGEDVQSGLASEPQMILDRFAEKIQQVVTDSQELGRQKERLATLNRFTRRIRWVGLVIAGAGVVLGVVTLPLVPPAQRLIDVVLVAVAGCAGFVIYKRRVPPDDDFELRSPGPPKVPLLARLDEAAAAYTHLVDAASKLVVPIAVALVSAIVILIVKLVA